MAVLAVQNLPYDTSTVANYKAIMQTYGTALTAFGWIQTADTGQVTWSGVSTLPGNGVFRDFEIWRMNDASQATMPVFMKLEYSTQGTNAPQLRLTVGTSSNGSGSITGTILESAVSIIGNNTVSLGAANNYACYYSGTAGSFVVLLWEGAAGSSPTTPLSWGIERSKTSTGGDTDEFVVFTGVAHLNGNRSRLMTKTGVVSTDEGRLHAVLSGTGTNNFNGTTAACPQFVLPGKLSNPLLNYAVVPTGDVGEGATVNANIEGTTHTYIACKASTNANYGFANCAGLGQLTSATLVRYE